MFKNNVLDTFNPKRRTRSRNCLVQLVTGGREGVKSDGKGLVQQISEIVWILVITVLLFKGS